MSDKIIVQGLHSAYREPLNYYPNGSFAVHWAQNSAYEISLTVLDDKSLAYSMLGVQSSVFWEGQEYIIKNCVDDHSGGISSKQISASHVYSECSRFRQHKVKTGTLTYTVNDVLSFIFDGNPLGFTYEVIGDFDKQQISDLGNCSGQDALSKIVETWPEAIIYPDNKNIRIYSHDAFARNYGNRNDYLNNANSVKITTDSTGIGNRTLASGMQKENTANDKPEYYFEPFIVLNQDSIDKWGLHEAEDTADERFNDKNAMKAYALSKLSSDPSLTIEVAEDTNEIPIPGDIRHLEVRPIGYSTNVEVVEFTYYPLDPGTNTSITLNNTAKTILEYQRRMKKINTQTVNNQKQQISGVQKDLNDLIEKNNTSENTIKTLTEKIKEMQSQIDQINGRGRNLIIAKDVISGALIDDGSVADEAGYFTTGFIEVVAGNDYAVTAKAGDGYIRLAEYDLNKDFEELTDYSEDTTTIEAGASTRFIRVSFQAESYGSPYKFEQGITATPWSPAPED